MAAFMGLQARRIVALHSGKLTMDGWGEGSGLETVPARTCEYSP